MLSSANKEQLSEISEYISAPFGVADDSGRVLYYKGLPDMEIAAEEISSAIACAQSEDTLNIYESSARFEKKGYIFENVSVSPDETLFMFLKSDPLQGGSEKLENILSLAAYSFRYREIQSSRDLINIFKKLLIEGRRGVTEEQIEALYGEYKMAASGFAVVLVSVNKSAGNMSPDSEIICRILQELFKSERGFIVIPIDYARTSVVCPLHEDITYDYICEYAGMIKDTLLSEAMTDAYVAVSSVIPEIMNLNDAYLEADKAKNIGAIFEMQEKCFEYTKLGLEKMIYSIPMDACVKYINETFGEGFLKDKSSQELLNTVKAYLDNNLNVSEASRVLYIHRNTLMYRLDKFNKMTGLDCSRFEVGMKVGIALLILQFIENKEPAMLNKA